VDARQRLLRRPGRDGLPFQSIRESCTSFITAIQFRPTLQAPHDDAENKGQVAQQRIFDGRLTRLDD
jgi:hypothetical protein